MPHNQPSSPSGLPWERGAISLSALARTWAMVTFRPGQAFSLPMGGQWTRWMLFAVIVNGVVMLATWALLALLQPSFSTFEFLQHQGFLILLYLVIMVYQAGLINVLIKFITRTHASFQTALRAACYSQSVMLFLILQTVSGASVLMICFFWNIVLMTIGTKHSYHVSTGRAVAVNVIYAVLTIFVQWVLLAGQT